MLPTPPRPLERWNPEKIKVSVELLKGRSMVINEKKKEQVWLMDDGQMEEEREQTRQRPRLLLVVALMNDWR
jgi:hypothetical protein